MAIPRYAVAVLDRPATKALAEFNGALLDWEVNEGDQGGWSVRAEDGHSLDRRHRA